MSEDKMTEPSSPSQSKYPTTLRVQHSHVPEMENAAPGDEVEFHVKGHVHSNRSGDKYSPGEAEVDVHHITPVKHSKKQKKNAANMPLDELGKIIKGSEPEEKE